MSNYLRSGIKSQASVNVLPGLKNGNVGKSFVPHKKTILLKKEICKDQMQLFQRNAPALTSIGCGPIRMAHTDVTKVPDFSAYRGETEVTKPGDVNSKSIFAYSMMFTSAVVATSAAKYIARTLINPLGPSAKTMAEGSTEINLANIPEGKNAVFEWRNKPLFVKHRTLEEIERERAVPVSDLRHPETDEQRTLDSKWLVCLGVCTHLGCVPIPNAGEFAGGYYCPCHGSHYDGSGRIRKGPAPLNLEVPTYKFVDENTLIVG